MRRGTMKKKKRTHRTATTRTCRMTDNMMTITCMRKCWTTRRQKSRMLAWRRTLMTKITSILRKKMRSFTLCAKSVREDIWIECVATEESYPCVALKERLQVKATVRRRAQKENNALRKHKLPLGTPKINAFRPKHMVGASAQAVHE